MEAGGANAMMMSPSLLMASLCTSFPPHIEVKVKVKDEDEVEVEVEVEVKVKVEVEVEVEIEKQGRSVLENN